MDQQADKTSKRKRLTEIVSGLGPDATPSQIREEAYRAGFGAINGGMLIAVRNDLWPERPKRGGGYSRAQRAKVGELAGRTVPCPMCKSTRVIHKHRYLRRDGSGMVTRERECSECGHKFKTTETDDGPLRSRESNRIRWATLTEKPCTYCKRVLPIDSFSLQSGSDVVRRPGCKECAANKRAEYIGNDLLKRYGISINDYNAILERQSARCAICESEDPFGSPDNNKRKRKRRTFSVDHCHSTGKVRGLLCARCNLAIGNFSDDTDLLRAAIAYIESHRETPNA